jgi:hypothetical protein
MTTGLRLQTRRRRSHHFMLIPNRVERLPNCWTDRPRAEGIGVSLKIGVVRYMNILRVNSSDFHLLFQK